MKFSETLQKILPFGYLFLVILGILKESIYYYQVGINILKYSNIMDILISPIADLTSTPLILSVFIVYLIILYIINLLITKNSNKDWLKKRINLKKPISEITEEEVKTFCSKLIIGIFAVSLLSFFLGIGLGSGVKVAKKISKNTLNYDYKMTFGDDEISDIFLIGSNSSYYFYVEKGSRNVKISPVLAIKSIEIIKNKRLNK